MTYDPVEVSNQAASAHPVDFYAKYTDIISGFSGVVTGITYTRRNVYVHLTRAGTANSKSSTHMFITDDLRDEEGNNVHASTPKLPVTMHGLYRDKVTAFEGHVVGVTYSANKCVQVLLATGTDDKEPISEISDIQNVEPIGQSKPHGMNSDTNPGAPIPGAIARLY